MSQIVRRKKKGRPSKADLERRNSTSSEPLSGDKEPRRSLRRRNVRYNFDFDDYIDDDDYQDDDEGFRKREKKLRLLLKLQGSSGTGKGDDSELTRRVDYDAPSPSAYSSESDEDDKPSKKRKVVGDDEIDGDDDEENEIEEEIEEAEERKAEASEPDSVPGTPAEDVDFPATELHMPDKKTIELILDKLQKKDIYGVYAEPVDPEELPDYHDVIKNPMDFATVRRKLGNGSYSRLEQLESDVFLICSNAMQYNAPDTVYHKQASSIQELARRKFQRLRDNVDRSEVELKSEDKTTSSSIFPRRQAKKPLDRSVQEPVGSDFSSGAALATTGEVQNGSMAARDASCERPRGVDGLKAENSLFTDNNIDKGEESLPGKNFLSRLGRKPSIQDENRRATYNLSDQPPTASESIFSTFEGEAKQLVPVGLQADHSYARSLARFAATLGSIAWKVASERIEQALPDGTKFGRGWVGEYEPLPTPVLILENCTIKEPIFPSSSKVRVNQKTSRDPVSVIVPESVPTLEGKPLLFGTSTSRAGTWLPAKEESPRGTSLDAQSPFFCPPGAKPSEFVNSNYRQQHSPSMNSGEPERNGSSKPLRNSVEPERKSSSAASPRGTLDQRAPFFCSPGAKPSELFSPNSRQQLSPFEPGRRGSLTPLGNSVEPERKSSSILSRNSVEPERSSLTPSRNSAEPERKSSSTLSRNSVEPERKSSLTASRNSAEPERKSSTQVELNHASSANKNTADFMRERQIPHNGSELPASWSAESVQRSRNLMPSASFKQPNSKTAQIGELHNKKPMGLYSNGMVPSSTNNYPNQMTGAGKYFPQQQQQQQEQGLSDPVQLMKMMAEKNQNQHKPPNISVVETQQAVSLPHAPSPKREESNNNAAVTAARAWMSLGASGFKPASENNGSHKMQIPADSLYNGTHKMQIPSDCIYNGTHNHQPQASRFRGELPPAGMQFQPDKNSFPVHAFVQQPVRMVNEAHSGQFQNRPMGFPQLVTADLSRFQMQSPWRGVSLQQMQQRQKQESLPPDLNIGFQSVGSPGRQQSSGVLVDSQQPDLALQL